MTSAEDRMVAAIRRALAEDRAAVCRANAEAAARRRKEDAAAQVLIVVGILLVLGLCAVMWWILNGLYWLGPETLGFLHRGFTGLVMHMLISGAIALVVTAFAIELWGKRRRTDHD